MKNWKDIWSDRNRMDDFVLQIMLKIDGFDFNSSLVTTKDFISHANKLSKK